MRFIFCVPKWTIVLLLFTASLSIAQAAPTLDDFLREPEVIDADLSPDGRLLALIINEPDRRLVVVRNVDESGMPIVGAFAEASVKPTWLSWANNDRLLVSMSISYDTFITRSRKSAYLQGRDDVSFSRMVSVNADMSEMSVLMENEANLRRNYSLSRVTNYIKNDPNFVLMAAYRSGKRTLYRVNVYSGEADYITKGSSRTYRFLSDDDGNPLYRFDYRERSKTVEIFEYQGHDIWERIDKFRLNKDDEDNLGTQGLVALHADNLVYRKQNRSTGYYELILIDRNSGERTVFAAPEGQDVYSALFITRSDQLVGYQVEDDYVRDLYFDEAYQARYDAIATHFENANFRVWGLGPDYRRTLVTAFGSDTPYSYYLWDYESQKLKFLAHADSHLAPEKLAKPALVHYPARDGTHIQAHLLLPEPLQAEKTYPTIILPHGGPQSRSRAVYDEFAQFMSTRGYIVVKPNFRGSTGFGRDFEAAGYRQWGGLMQDDLTDAANFMIEKGYADPERICIVGGSYGGYAALMGAVKTPHLFKCAVSLNGVTHLPRQVKHDMKEVDDKDDRQELIFDRIGHPKQDKAMLELNSPALHADRIRIPVMIVAGTDDDVVPYSQARLMVKALKKANVEHEFITLKDTGHNPFYYQEDIEAVFKAVDSFLAQHLQ